MCDISKNRVDSYCHSFYGHSYNVPSVSPVIEINVTMLTQSEHL